MISIQPQIHCHSFPILYRMPIYGQGQGRWRAYRPPPQFKVEDVSPPLARICLLFRFFLRRRDFSFRIQKKKRDQRPKTAQKRLGNEFIFAIQQPKISVEAKSHLQEKNSNQKKIQNRQNLAEKISIFIAKVQRSPSRPNKVPRSPPRAKRFPS